MMFECGERDQYPSIGKGGHPPLQAFLGPGCRCTNTRMHFTQFFLSLFGGGMDVLADAFRWRFFWSHDFILSTLLPILQSVLPAAENETASADPKLESILPDAQWSPLQASARKTHLP